MLQGHWMLYEVESQLQKRGICWLKTLRTYRISEIMRVPHCSHHPRFLAGWQLVTISGYIISILKVSGQSNQYLQGFYILKGSPGIQKYIAMKIKFKNCLIRTKCEPGSTEHWELLSQFKGFSLEKALNYNYSLTKQGYWQNWGTPQICRKIWLRKLKEETF